MAEDNALNGDLLQDLLRRCLDKDVSAFNALIERNQQYAYPLAYRLLLNKQDAEDVVQESFLRVWKHLDRFNINRKFTTWLYTIVTNLCYDHLKSAKRKETDLPLENLGTHHPFFQEGHASESNNIDHTVFIIPSSRLSSIFRRDRRPYSYSGIFKI